MIDRWRALANLATLGNAVLGVAAVLYVLAGNPVWALALVTAGVGLDGLDGRFSRRSTKPARRFGRFADSIADAITFGVAPFFLLAVHTSDAALWATVDPLPLLVGAAYLAAAIARLVYFTGWGFERSHFLGVPTPQGALTLALLILALGTPAFVGVRPDLLLGGALLLAALLVVPIPFPKIRRGNPLRPVFLVTGIAWVVALIPIQFAPAAASPLYLLSEGAAGVAGVGLIAYYLIGPWTVWRESRPSGGPS
jgi:archaetidylserine synthase